MSFRSLMITYILLDLFANTKATCTDVEGWTDSSGKQIQLIELKYYYILVISLFEAFCESLSCWREKTSSK